MIMNTVDLAKKIRIHALRMTSRGGSSHIGSILSISDIMAVLYGKILKVDAKNPKWVDRDRFILSKGHAGAAVYAALAESGFMPVEKLMTHYQDGSDLSGHVSHKGIPGVELSTGSLGHGLSVATGMALAAKLDDKAWRAFCLLSDGEMDEGSNWEPIMFASHHKLDNLIAIVDYNKIQSLGSIASTLALEPFATKWRAFGWKVVEVDGHNHADLEKALLALPKTKNKPTVVICHTTKGKGVSFMENSVLWHYRTARNEEFDAALKELEAL
jgi:transketolase